VGLRQGVQAEVLTSLALVMITGTVLLAAVFLEINHARIEGLHDVLGRGFAAQVETSRFTIAPNDGALWWRVDGSGRAAGINASTAALDPGTRALAIESLEQGVVLVESGAPWVALRFAAPEGHSNTVIAGRIEAPVSGIVLTALVVIDVLIFGLFGVTLLRRRVVGPLHRLSRAVDEIREGEFSGAVPVEGAGEIEALGRAFNEMQSALAARTGALEKAVCELRAVNASLLQARDGLDRAERLAMVGSLAAGVAHEVGNPMGALLAFLDLASRDSGLSAESRGYLDRASEQGERVRVILRQLLDFSRPPEIERRPIELEAIARQVVDLISAQQEFSDIEFDIDVEEGIGSAIGDSSIASQILLNLALNAAFAMKESSIKRIRFEVTSTVLRRRAGETNEGRESSARDDAIVCRVIDSGPGVGLDDPQRVFDPFFTTKAPGEGTGLGLANARRLAQEMVGRVELREAVSSLGGARFDFLLTRSDERPSGEANPSARSPER
jgi:signal transduction histidine kinase